MEFDINMTCPAGLFRPYASKQPNDRDGGRRREGKEKTALLRLLSRWCERRELNPYALWTHAPQTCLSAYSSTLANDFVIISHRKSKSNVFYKNNFAAFSVDYVKDIVDGGILKRDLSRPAHACKDRAFVDDDAVDFCVAGNSTS